MALLSDFGGDGPVGTTLKRRASFGWRAVTEPWGRWTGCPEHYSQYFFKSSESPCQVGALFSPILWVKKLNPQVGRSELVTEATQWVRMGPLDSKPCPALGAGFHPSAGPPSLLNLFLWVLLCQPHVGAATAVKVVI